MTLINRTLQLSSCIAATAMFALVGLWTGPVIAQSELLIEQITVTARKKEENLQEVPLSITAFSSQTLKDARIQNLSDLSAFTPGLSLFNPQGEFLPTPVIRGMAPTDIFGEPNAALFIDGVYVAGREGLNFSYLEVERIEVVKGPQTALYGRNAFSGAINFITKRPTAEFGSKVEVMVGNDGRTLGQFNLGGPIAGNTLTGRIGLAYDNFDGSYKDTTGGTDVGGYEYQTFTAGLSWLPTDRVDILAQIYLSDDEITPSAVSSLTLNCENTVDPSAQASAYPDNRFLAWCGTVPNMEQTNAQLAIGDDKVINKAPGVIGEERELTRGSLNIDWDLDFGTFTLLTGYSKTKQSSVTDFNRNLGETQPYEYCLTFPCAQTAVKVFTTGMLNPELGVEREEWSQEIRFTSPRDRAVRYSMGGSYYTTDAQAGGGWAEATNFKPAGARLGNFVPSPFPRQPHSVLFPIGDNIYGGSVTQAGVEDSRREGAASRLRNDRDGWRVFGLVEWDIADAWTLELQLGYTDEEKEFLDDTKCFDSGTSNECIDANGDLISPPVSGQDSWDYVDGRVSLTYSVSANWNVYGTIATSTKPGALETITGDVFTAGPGSPILDDQTHVNSVDVEELTAYEIGAKGSAWDGRLVLDGAVFYNDWTDVVLRENINADPTTGLLYDEPQARKVNAGDVTIWGIEFSATAAFNERWSGRLTVGFQDAEWDNGQLESLFPYPSFGGPQCFPTTPDLSFAPPPSCGDLTGQTMSRQPELQGAVNLTYQRPITGDWEWFTRGDLTYEDEWFPQDDNLAIIPEHTYLNLSVGVKSDRWAFTLWANNLLGEDDPIATYRDIYFGNTDNVNQALPLVGRGPQQIVPLRYTVNHPRLTTYGLTVQARFGT